MVRRTVFEKGELDDRYVTKDSCENKKQKYIPKEICDLRMITMEKDIKEIKRDLEHLNTKIDAQGCDITEIKTKLNVGGMDRKVMFQLTGIITGLVTVIQTIIFYLVK